LEGELPTDTTAPPPLAPLLTAADVAAAAQISQDRVWALTREGKLRRMKLGRRTYRYRADHVTEDLEALER
jgi:hypothetical protein